MRHLSRLFTVAAIVITVCLALFSVPHSVHASGAVTSYTLTCSSFSATGTTDNTYLGLEIHVNSQVFIQGFLASGGVASGTVTFPLQPQGTIFLIYVQGSSSPSGNWDNQSYSTLNLACHGGGGGPVTFFNPADGRLNGQPGDRIVVYCNSRATPPNIDVWVIDNGSVGHELAKLPLSDLTSVPEGTFAKNLGANGVIFAGSDANGNGYAALQGGPYSGTATGDWLKAFICKAS